MGQDTLVICYEGIQRIYRNAIVRFLRENLKCAFPQDYSDKLRTPFQKEWELLVKNAYASRRSGELDIPLIDEFDLLSVNHFFNLFDAYYDVLCTQEAAYSEQEKKKRRETLLNWSKLIKNLRDPLSHPSEVDFSREDSFLLLDCARRVLLRFDVLEDADKIKKLTDRLWSDRRREPLESQLPARDAIVVDFVGRAREMGQLWEWFRDPASRRWALAGEGGKGKSALAYNFALAVTEEAPHPFQSVFWMSAKKKKFLERKAVPTEPDFSDLDSVLSRLLIYYGWVDEAVLPIETKRQRVLELLREFPAFVIVDDVDSIESENENVIEFFSLELPKTSSKVLFASRRTIFGMGGSTTHVTGFDEPDAAKFIISRCNLMELDPAVFDKHAVHKIVKITEGSPLYIEDLMRFSAAVKSVDEAMTLWQERTGSDARRYALGRECDLLTPSARKVLLTACICPRAASFVELEEISGLSSETVTAAIHELQDLFLIPKPRLIEGEQRFEINVNTRALIREVHGGDDTYRRLEEACRTISEGVPETGRGAVAAIIRQAVFLERGLKHADAEQLLLNALEKYPSHPDLIGVLGKIYRSWSPPRVTDARERFLRAWQLKCSRQEMYEYWCQMELKEREWTRAAEAAEKGLKRLPESRRLLYLAGYARTRLARELEVGLHHSKAQKELSEARRLLEQALLLPRNLDAADRHLNADIYRCLVLTCELSGDISSLKHYFKLWRTEHPDDPDAASEWVRLSAKYGLS